MSPIITKKSWPDKSEICVTGPIAFLSPAPAFRNFQERFHWGCLPLRSKSLNRFILLASEASLALYTRYCIFSYSLHRSHKGKRRVRGPWPVITWGNHRWKAPPGTQTTAAVLSQDRPPRPRGLPTSGGGGGSVPGPLLTSLHRTQRSPGTRNCPHKTSSAPRLGSPPGRHPLYWSTRLSRPPVEASPSSPRTSSRSNAHTQQRHRNTSI